MKELKNLNNMKLFTEIEFFDGESIDNKYFLLGNSENYVVNINGIDTETGLNFLFENSKKYNYFFRIDYDFNCIIKDIEKEKLNDLFSGKTIRYKDFILKYFRHKILSIKKINSKKEAVFYDIYNFFNKSFIEVMKILELDKEYKKEYEFIKEYKLKRNIFNEKILNEIIEYNKKECFIGLKIVEKIYNLLPNDLKTLKLYGSSSITNIYLRKNEIDKKIRNYKLKKINSILKDCYYGGRMECIKIGFFENCFKYDINSAYPYIINQLKIIKDIVLIKKDFFIEKYDIYKIELEITNEKMIGLLPVRLKNGMIVYPNKVTGYYYGFEVEAVDLYSKKYDFVKYKIKKQYHIVFEDKKLLNDIEKIYQLKNYYKKKKDLKYLIYKILLNSIYGKFAQKMGRNLFNSYYYAGVITSGIRGKILIDFIDNWNDIIFIATDGVFTQKKIDLEISDRLGAYEEIEIKKGYVIMSGVYYLIDTNGNEIKGERGFRINYKEALKLINEKGYYYIHNNFFISRIFAFKNYKKYGKYENMIIEIQKKLDITNQIKRKFVFPKKDYLKYQIESYILNEKDLKKLSKIKIDNFDYLDLLLLE